MINIDLTYISRIKVSKGLLDKLQKYLESYNLHQGLKDYVFIKHNKKEYYIQFCLEDNNIVEIHHIEEREKKKKKKKKKKD